MRDGIMIGMDNDGTWRIKEEPYATIECETEDDYQILVKSIDKQTPMLVATNGKCKRCKETLRNSSNYCSNCGQKAKWS